MRLANRSYPALGRCRNPYEMPSMAISNRRSISGDAPAGTPTSPKWPFNSRVTKPWTSDQQATAIASGGKETTSPRAIPS